MPVHPATLREVPPSRCFRSSDFASSSWVPTRSRARSCPPFPTVPSPRSSPSSPSPTAARGGTSAYSPAPSRSSPSRSASRCSPRSASTRRSCSRRSPGSASTRPARLRFPSIRTAFRSRSKRNIRTFRRRTRGSGRIILRLKKRTRSQNAFTSLETGILNVAAASTVPNGIGRRFGIVNAKIPKFSTPLILGSNLRTLFPRISRAIRSRRNCFVGSVERDIRRCGSRGTAVFRAPNSSRPLTNDSFRYASVSITRRKQRIKSPVF